MPRQFRPPISGDTAPKPASGEPNVTQQPNDGSNPKIASNITKESLDCCSGATGVGGGLHLTWPEQEIFADDRERVRPFSGVPIPSDPGMAALHRDQMRASAIVAALRRAFIEGDVSICLTRNRVTFEWLHSSDALFVFEAVTGKQP